MFLALVAAVQLAAAPPEIAYLPIPGANYRASASAETLLLSLAAEPGPRLRRAALPTGDYAACLARLPFVDHADGCVRALLPREDGGAPIVAVYVEEVRRPNIIGTVVNKSLTIRCIGRRAVARAELSGGLDTPHEVERARAPVRQCLAEAVRTPDAATQDPATGGATWRFPIQRDGLTRDLSFARGNALERAIVEIEERYPPGQRSYRDCTLTARVSRVLGGWWLRGGDTVLLGVPCGTNGVRHGQPAHMLLSFERELRYLEPL